MENLTDDTFKNEIENGMVVVDFYADWCGPCRMVKPFLEKKQVEFPSVKFFKVDTEECDRLTSIYQVRALPTIIIFKNGKEEERIVGFSAQTIEEKIRKVVG
jgi:thioredoxin 1